MGPAYDQLPQSKEVEIFNAMQRLSLFMLNRTAPDSKVTQLHGVDEQSKALVRSIFNDTSTRMLDSYERKAE